MEQSLTDGIEQREAFIAAKKVELASFENKIISQLDFVKDKKRELEEVVLTEVAANAKIAKNDIERESAARQESINNLREVLDVSVTKKE